MLLAVSEYIEFKGRPKYFYTLFFKWKRSCKFLIMTVIILFTQQIALFFSVHELLPSLFTHITFFFFFFPRVIFTYSFWSLSSSLIFHLQNFVLFPMGIAVVIFFWFHQSCLPSHLTYLGLIFRANTDNYQLQIILWQIFWCIHFSCLFQNALPRNLHIILI